jgi:hypothetical protein
MQISHGRSRQIFKNDLVTFKNVTFKFDAQFKKWFVAKFAVGTLNFNFSSQFDCALSSKPFLRRDKITIMISMHENAATKKR